MADVLIRKCGHCGNDIVIERNNISGVLYFDKKYYHDDCFVEAVKDKPLTKTGKPSKWHKALDDLPALANKAKEELEYYWVRDDFYNWILSHYDVIVLPDRFWSTICGIGNGKYRNKKCKPIPLETIYGTWRWGQKKLDKINVNNKKNHRGPADDDERLLYDLSIVVSKVPNYLTHLSKMKALEAETRQATEKTKINYNNLERQANTNQIDDISDMLDEIF